MPSLLSRGVRGLALDCGKLEVAQDPYICMQPLRINRGAPGSLLHPLTSKLRAETSTWDNGTQCSLPGNPNTQREEQSKYLLPL